MINNITPQTVGERIKFLREKNNESQEKLGEAIGLSQNSISKLEKGDTQLTLENQCSLVKHFNVSHDYLISGKDNDSMLVLLERYVSMDYSNISEGGTTLECPVLRINKILFNYLIRTARAKQDKYLPDDIKKAWIEREISSFYELNANNKFTESESVVPVPQKLIYPDEKKADWKQSDLLREMNKELLDGSNTNSKESE
jgi:transcriptional regulator with XRE-family HTH domain